MSFVIDKQTLDDLGVFSHGGNASLYGMFNVTHTRGGAQLLEEMFMQPLNDCAKIESRAAAIDYFRRQGTAFPFKGPWFDAAEHYLADTDRRKMVNPDENALQKKMRRIMKTDTEFQMLHNGILSLVDILTTFDDFVGTLDAPEFAQYAGRIRELLGNPALRPVKDEKGARKLSMRKVAELDKILRYELRGDILKLLHYIHILDIYLSVAGVAAERGYVKATALPAEANLLEADGLFHPQLAAPVANSIGINVTNNIIFLTGANMAGKSTFMKSLGTAVFLAHVGFPVPARSMRFSVRNGMYSSINLPDNLAHGYSHFYAEVLRLKKVAGAVNHYGNMVVIFDELFRGTNVKDAYDATIAITEAFAHIKHCIFVISTHVIEAGEVLGQRCGNIDFVFFPTVMQGSAPVYPYTLSSGITADRHGMLIINNEGIVEIIRGGGKVSGGE